MAWAKDSSTTLSSASGTIASGTITTPHKFNQYLVNIPSKSNINGLNFTFNSDTSSNYADRNSVNGGADSTSTSNGFYYDDNTGGSASGGNARLQIGYIINISTEEKLGITFTVDSNGSASSTAPIRSENVGKWSNTSNQINSWGKNVNQGVPATATLGIDSNLSVLGTD